ncbi:anthranilate synthase component 1 [Elysia marginata]|uniref:Anthranilate synthase component 1 n=1 Tax=Elysia marginata TaxID=1093978 RepID=A0AAV4F0B4_9GAST|nr:anthranilate synthase component 1 [Elysia marginata]
MGYEMVKYFEDIDIDEKPNSSQIPLLYYSVFQNIIAIDHFKDECYLFYHFTDHDNDNLDELEHLIKSKPAPSYSFEKYAEPNSNLTDDEYKKFVAIAREHCRRGDVFQLVLSRRFCQGFKGDEFNVYRALRSINPSPYLFYFDYGGFKIFGSSPEAQLIVKDGIAEIHPIAGTFKRTGNDAKDNQLANKLSNDKKENAEHVMLVDLARNDLSRNSYNLKVETYKEVQFFSHVIHLVSKVVGSIHKGSDIFQLVADTFPAGTLSGAPKHKAMQLIECYEPSSRGIYGGAIGFMDFNGNFNHAIIIRSFLSEDYQLVYQAGAGIVFDSSEEGELQEVYNKLKALNKALDIAENL